MQNVNNDGEELMMLWQKSSEGQVQLYAEFL
jgi:hypothetical protein